MKSRTLISKDVLWLILDKVILLILTFIGSIATYRVIGPDNAGSLNVAIGFWGLFGFLLSMGLDTLSVKFILKSNYVNKSLSSIIFIRLLGGIFALFIANSLIYFYTDNDQVILLLLIVSSLGLFSPFLVLDSFIQAKEDFFSGVRMRVISKVLALLYLYLIIIFGMSVYYFALYHVIFNAILSFQYYRYLRMNTIAFDFIKTINMRLTNVYFKQALPFMFSAIMIPIFMQSDVLMVNYYLGESSAGYYSASSKLLIPITQVMSVFAIAYFPKLMKSDDIDHLISRLSALVLSGSLIITLPIFLYSESIVEILYGKKYLPTAEVLDIHIFSLAIIVLGPLGTRWLIAKNLVKYELYKTATAALINVVLNYILINRMGMAGAAYASLISYIVANILCLLVSGETRPLVYAHFSINRLIGKAKITIK